MNKLIATISIILLCNSIFAQIDPRLGYDLFNATNYLDANVELKKHLKVDPKDSKALFHVGLCYLYTNINKANAIKYFERCLDSPKPDKETLFYLGLAYSHEYNYDKAIETLEKYLLSPGKNADETNLKIDQFKKAKELYQNKLDVSFENLGEKVNSISPDYAPFCSKNESMIVFTSRREEGKGRKEFDGYYPSDIFTTKYDGFRFQPVKPVGLNSNFDESCVGIYDDGSQIFIYFDNISEVGEIYFSELPETSFSKKKKIPEGVNDPKSIETSASISNDENTLFFATNRDGGKGGLDLYMTRKIPNGKWAEPQNLKLLNTTGNEDFPTLSADGQTLYFCSDGHGGLGGYDLFQSTWNSETNEWSSPENLGFPINTSYDDKVISFTNDKKHAYVSQVRDEGFGDFDIYRITINDEELMPAIFKIYITDETTSEKVTFSNIIIYNKNDDIVGEYNTNTDNSFIATLHPGTYLFEIEANGYELSEQTLKVSGLDSEKGIIELTYKISK